VSLRRVNGILEIGVCVTRPFPRARVVILDAQARVISEWTGDLEPAKTLEQRVKTGEATYSLSVTAADGSEIIEFDPPADAPRAAPELANEPPMPDQIKSQDELYLTGVHLRQYRHASRKPEIYWTEALRRDPGDYRSNTALGNFYLRRGELAAAERHLRLAIASLTRLNYNPADGEPFYLLGLTLRFLDDLNGAYAAFYKATWNQAWIAAGYLALAEMDISRSQWKQALTHLARSLAYNAENMHARNLKVIVLRKLGQFAEADHLLKDSLKLDPLDAWARDLAGDALPVPNQQLLDVSFDYARSGLFAESSEVIRRMDLSANDGSLPVCLYALAHLEDKIGEGHAAAETRKRAQTASPSYCFPCRLEEMVLLAEQVTRDPQDSRALYYLGNLLYDKRRHTEAIECWRKSADLKPEFSTVWRNLGIGYFNTLQDEAAAAAAFEHAFSANPDDARVFFERDQLWKRIGKPIAERLKEMERHPRLVKRRDDLSVELAALYNQIGQPAQALALLASRRFQPWEGGEGLAIAQYGRAHISLGRNAVANGHPKDAVTHFAAALETPENLGEARHVLTNSSNIFYWLGVAYDAAGQESAAKEWWGRAASYAGDFQQMSVKRFSEMTLYSALSMQRLGRAAQAMKLAADLSGYARYLGRTKAQIDYFATSLPTLLLFHDNLDKRQKRTAAILQAQTDCLKGHKRKAAKAFERILKQDPSNEIASDMLRELPQLTQQQEAHVNA
jgi:tetratricopeptide (TPR) repeat protein